MYLSSRSQNQIAASQDIVMQPQHRNPFLQTLDRLAASRHFSQPPSSAAPSTSTPASATVSPSAAARDADSWAAVELSGSGAGSMRAPLISNPTPGKGQVA
jgi:hypothetical protein